MMMICCDRELFYEIFFLEFDINDIKISLCHYIVSITLTTYQMRLHAVGGPAWQVSCYVQ